MTLTYLDWCWIALYFAINGGIGLYYRARAGKSVDEFFLSGRNVPWWPAGTSMVATTFAADTPLAVTGMVARGGIAGNWLWWSFVASGMLTVFFYARLWRRCGVMTDIEFTEIRYSGRPAVFLCGFRALYQGIPINCIILGRSTPRADASEALGIEVRRDARHYTSEVPLNRFVDAVRPESESVRRLEREVQEVAANVSGSPAALADLKVRLTEWSENDSRFKPPAELASLSRNLSTVASIGLRALEYLKAGTAAPADWASRQRRILDEIQKPNAEVILAAVRPVRLLVEAVSPKDTNK